MTAPLKPMSDETTPEAALERLRSYARSTDDNIPFHHFGKIDELTEIVRLALTKQEASAWLPIETARKNGTAIQIWNEFGEWTPRAHYANGWVEHYFDADQGGMVSREIYRATHWQPLPAPPTKEQADD